MIISFPERTKARIEQLSAYVAREVLSGDGSFVCRHYQECRNSCRELCFYEGQLHHVGRHYDLEVDGKPTRIVFVGQEYGHPPSRVNLEERHEMIAEDSRSNGFRGRNPHMKGTTTLLRLLLGREPGIDPEGEQLLPSVHLFDGFALVNYLLCSAVGRSSRHGLSSQIMRKNCASHFQRSIEILDPTIIVAQGISVRGWIEEPLGLPPWERERGPIEKVSTGTTQATLLTFAHPSARGYGMWGNSPTSQYVQEIVVPTIKTCKRGPQPEESPATPT